MKKLIHTFLLIAFAAAANSSFGQFSATWSSQFSHTVSQGYSNEGRRIAEDASGNIFMLADATSDIDPFGIQGTGNYFYTALIKYSTNGAVLNSVYIDVHNHNVSGYSSTSSFGLELDAAGNVYIGYNIYGNLTNFDVVLSKYSNSLALVWSNTYGTPLGNDQGVDLKLHPSGTLYAIVKSSGTSTLYSIIKSNSASSTPTIVLASAGQGAIVLNSIALDGGQTAYVAGSVLKGLNKDAFVAAVNLSSNSLIWTNTYSPKGLNGDDVINQIVVGIDGNIYSVGTTYQGSFSGNDVLVLKNLAGSSRFNFALALKGSNVNDSGRFIHAQESGWLYIGAVSGNDHAIVYRIPSTGVFSNAGQVVFSPTPSSPYNSISGVSLNAMKVSSAKNIYITGGVTASGPSGTFTSCYLYKASVVFGNALIQTDELPVTGDFDDNLEGIDLSLDYAKADVYLLSNSWDDIHGKERIQVVDVNVPSPLRKGQHGELVSVLLNPNPAHGSVLVSSDSPIRQIVVMDVTGQQVMLIHSSSTQVSLHLEGLIPGIYFCKLTMDSGEMIRRLVIN